MITQEEMTTQLREIIAEHPDETRTCRYVVDDAPHCIAGVWFHRFGGLSVADLRACEGFTAAAVTHKHMGGLVTHGAGILLDRAQFIQDEGCAWSVVLEKIAL